MDFDVVKSEWSAVEFKIPEMTADCPAICTFCPDKSTKQIFVLSMAGILYELRLDIEKKELVQESRRTIAQSFAPVFQNE